jgi:hypothetical protein
VFCSAGAVLGLRNAEIGSGSQISSQVWQSILWLPHRLSGGSMIPADFDALWFALGIKRRDWTKPQETK